MPTTRFYMTLALIIMLGLIAIGYGCSVDQADAATPHHKDPLAVAQTAWRGSPCTGKISIIWTHSVVTNDHVAEAMGINIEPDGSWHRDPAHLCQIAIDPVYYHAAGYDEKLAIDLHEAGHLAHGPAHHPGEGWIMSADHSGCKPLCRLFPIHVAAATYSR